MDGPIVRHSVPETQWPDAATARASRWFSPVQLGPVQAQTRTWVPAMVPWRATDDGEVTANVLDWYECFARGKPGVLVVEGRQLALLRSWLPPYLTMCKYQRIQLSHPK